MSAVTAKASNLFIKNRKEIKFISTNSTVVVLCIFLLSSSNHHHARIIRSSVALFVIYFESHIVTPTQFNLYNLWYDV